MATYLVDTNVLLRAAQRESPEHGIATGAIASLEARGEMLCLATQVLVEFWVVATRPVEVNGLGWPTDLVKLEIEWLLSHFPLLQGQTDTITHWLRLVAAHDIKGKRAHDVKLVALMLANDVTHLLTFNIDDFKALPDITLVHPTAVP
jgi:predicted nucleic acid-binding protein